MTRLERSTTVVLDDGPEELEHLKPRLILLGLLGGLTLLVALLDHGPEATQRRVLCATFSLFAALVIIWYRQQYRTAAAAAA